MRISAIKRMRATSSRRVTVVVLSLALVWTGFAGTLHASLAQARPDQPAGAVAADPISPFLFSLCGTLAPSAGPRGPMDPGEAPVQDPWQAKCPICQVFSAFAWAVIDHRTTQPAPHAALTPGHAPDYLCPEPSDEGRAHVPRAPPYIA